MVICFFVQLNWPVLTQSLELSEIKTLLGTIKAAPSSKRDIVSTATSVAGGAVTEVESVANPALSPVEGIAGPTLSGGKTSFRGKKMPAAQQLTLDIVTGSLPGGLKRDVTNLVSALPVAQSVVADIQSKTSFPLNKFRIRS
jgi:hypothetical protein